MAKREQSTTLSKKHQDRLHRERRQTRLIVIASVSVLALVVLVIILGILNENYFKYWRSVAQVNNERITAQEFRSYTKYYRYNIIQSAQSTLQIAQMFGGDPNMLQNFLGQLQSAKASLEPETAAQTALNQMVDNDLVIQEAKKRGITVSAEEIEAKKHEVLGYFPNGTPTPTNTRMPLATSTLSPLQLSLLKPTATPTLTPTLSLTETQALAATASAAVTPTEAASPTATGPITPTSTPLPTATATPYTLEGYQSAYATMVGDFNTNFEIPESTLIYIITSQLYHDKLQEQVIGDIPCTQEQVWAQHILVQDAALAKTIQEQAKAGEDWYNLAATYSTDTSNKDQGGDLGWFSRGQMVKEFEDAAFTMQPGQISDPVQTQFGYHIIRVLGHEDRPLTTAECTRMKAEKFQTWLKDLRDKSQVTLYDYWKEIYPLQPTLPAEVDQIIQNAAAAGAGGGGAPGGAIPVPQP
jgi:peptidyl-prolyl cis-trans isomerase D